MMLDFYGMQLVNSETGNHALAVWVHVRGSQEVGARPNPNLRVSSDRAESKLWLSFENESLSISIPLLSSSQRLQRLQRLLSEVEIDRIKAIPIPTVLINGLVRCEIPGHP